ncbi:AmiS/UreI family transporter [Intrasporangium sp.]|uniref:AmiS/UreI family transporter n=1 Tax=Intrasporangium sp. TaxID=1925024 RepID=UPI0032218715
MSNVGLFYVGAVLFINGLALLGRVKGAGAVPLNVFVGFLQVITPTYLIISSGGNQDVIFGASGLYLFGFTYLYVAMNEVWGFDGTGLGWFSLFVAVAAIGYAVVNVLRYQDWAFGVIWLLWAYLWWLFFDLLGRENVAITAYTGAVAAIEGWTTAAIPAFLLLTGQWTVLPNPVMAVLIAVVSLAGFVLAKVRLARRPPLPTAPATSTREGV